MLESGLVWHKSVGKFWGHAMMNLVQRRRNVEGLCWKIGNSILVQEVKGAHQHQLLGAYLYYDFGQLPGVC